MNSIASATTALLSAWLDEVSDSSYIWFVKRLSANDTLANGSHQAGPYIPKSFLFDIFPSLNRPEVKNPDINFRLKIDSHRHGSVVRAIWYNNKLHENPKSGRNETRMTNFGGIESPVLDPDNTGALTVFAFQKAVVDSVETCRVWVCRNENEEMLVEELVGAVEPGRFTTWPANTPYAKKEIETRRTSCYLSDTEIPDAWLKKFPSGEEIIRKTIEMRADSKLSPDERLMSRRDCEYEIFRSIENAIEMPKIKSGFSDIESFVARAQTILQRRKARAGHSLEYHVRDIFIEEGLVPDVDFSHQPESESGKTPDFIFPSEKAYKDPSFDAGKLRMLAIKTTCKDRWRQILNEADRIPQKHLLTLQEGVSENQFREMEEAGVQLVVPERIIKNFPTSVRPRLKRFSDFIVGLNVSADR